MTVNAPDMIVRYIPRHLVERYVALGWVAHYDCFDRIYHGTYSVLCEWPIENGKPIEPPCDEAQP